MKKTFVLDTNVILHDSTCIYQFGNHDIIIPITVIEELDRFKKGNRVINCNARDFLRSLDALSSEKVLNGGTRIGPGQGKISICLGFKLNDIIQQNFKELTSDVWILNTVLSITRKYKSKKLILVTKDVNLRLKAKSIGLETENYTSNFVENPSDIYGGIQTVENVDGQLFESVYAKPYAIEPKALVPGKPLLANENIILKNGSRSALAVYDKKNETIQRVMPRTCHGITPRNAEQIFALNAMLNPEIPLVTISGKAGTGKTLLALAAALESKRFYHQIFVTRPVVPLSNKDLGYLPGDINSKLDPYMQPLYDNMSVIEDGQPGAGAQSGKLRKLVEDGKIVITPISFIRGRSIVKVFFIVDEAQNLTPHEVKTIITRAGQGTKIVFTGDIFQIDHPYLDSQTNGLAFIIEKMKGESLYAHINLEKGERSDLAELASKIL
ncbi:MAG: PhoH family protein [Desulfobacula sp.]|jgi:PhoH-like ATPase|nr:PhoH family protein [Deltaproteobacteria bacterium]MBT6339429.1 PhoH family protein [Desulfobacula sp.]